MSPLQEYYATSTFWAETRKQVQDVVAKELQEHYQSPVESPSAAVREFDSDKVIWIDQLSRLHTLLSDTGTRVGIPIPQKPRFGTLPLGSVNAMILTVPGSAERLVVFNDGLFLFVHLFVKIMVLCFQELAPARAMLGKKKTAAAMQKAIASRLPPEAHVHFHDLLCAYVLRGHPGKASPWLLPAKVASIQELLLTACELFVLSHEYGHIVTEQNTSVNNAEVLTWADLAAVRRNFTREMQADFWGANLTLLGIPGKGNMPYAFAGIEIFFQGAEMVERALSILENGIEGGAEGQTHPPSNDRRIMLRRSLVREWGPNMAQVFGLGNTVIAICETLWAKERKFFLDKWVEGVKPARIWTALA
jgi:hypothetical protein